ncbi:MAG: RNA polymerase sigma factor [Acidobacteria bacterium]|nr:RNA polymerase sigma factor [Acidobacteriota bacterium]
MSRMEDHLDDRELAAAFAARGDETAFRELYRRHSPALYLLAVRLLGGTGRGAEDAVQETWTRAAARLASFRWESALRTWLSGIAVNVCRETGRSAPPERSIEIDPEPADPGVVDGAARLDLEEAIRRLPAGARMVMVLHDVEGRTHAEIGATLGIDEGTSKSQLHKARRAVRAALTREGPERKRR